MEKGRVSIKQRRGPSDWRDIRLAADEVRQVADALHDCADEHEAR